MPFVAVATFLLVVAPQISWAQTASANGNGAVEAQVRAYFKDIPAMIPIAQCESEFTQFNKNGTVLHGGTDNSMIGIYQINAPVHTAYAKSIGIDINTVEGNLAYARLLYKREKTAPWISSFPCWHLLTPGATSSVPDLAEPDAQTLSSNLTLGMADPQVVLLQKLLNKTGFIVTDSGDGSPGNETNKFGSLTRAAVRNFQCTKGIVCEGDEYTTGYGLVDVRTRVALMYAAQQSIASAQSAVLTSASSSAVSQASSDHVAQITQLQSQLTQLQKVLTDLMQGNNA